MSVWDEIKTKLRVEDVISEYVPIKSAGTNYKCVCPFHNEKSGSLMISPEKQIWHCFGCGAGGDVFRFVQDIENISKQETLQKLARKANVKLEKLASDKKTESKTVEQVSLYEQGSKYLNWSSDVYHAILLKILQDRNNPITQYILSRGLTPKLVEDFKLGYAPRNNTILEFAKKHSLGFDLLQNVGILKKSESGQLSDKFKDRLMIPIVDSKSNVVGFTGRVLPYDKSDRPKYLNSSQSEWFNKSEIWFGWPLSRKQIIQQKHAIIVEGNMDVIAAYRHDLNFALASQGTSFTQEQLRILSGITKTIWLAFDNDNAGKIAGDKLYKAASKLGFDVQKLVVPEKFKDLDEYLQNQNPKLEEIEIKNYLEYALQERETQLTSHNTETQKKAVLDVLDMMTYLDDITKDQFAGKISQITTISKTTLQGILSSQKIEKQETTSEQDNTIAPVKNPYASVLVTFQKLLLSKDSAIDENLEHLFVILKQFIGALQEYETLQQYLDSNQTELQFMKQNDSFDNSPEYRLKLWSLLMAFVSQHLSAFIIFDKPKQSYMHLMSVDKTKLGI